jgi:iduronate 2-sulfatase
VATAQGSFNGCPRSTLVVASGPIDGGHHTAPLVSGGPRLSDLTIGGCPRFAPERLNGRSLRPQLLNPAAPAAKPAHGFWTGGQRTIRTERWRLIMHPKKDADSPQVELFDYTADPDETRNVAAEHRAVVADLVSRLDTIPAISASKQDDP